MDHDPGEQFFITSTGQHPLLKGLSFYPEELDEILIETYCDVVVILNLARMAETNLVDESPQVGNAAKESFGAAGIDASICCVGWPT